MTTLLLVLKIIGLVVLGLLALVVFALLLILFWPVRYRALVSYHDAPFADVRVGWIGIVGFKLRFEKSELWYRLRVFWITLKEKGGSGKKKKAKKSRLRGRKRRKDTGNKDSADFSQEEGHKKDKPENKSPEPFLQREKDELGGENPEPFPKGEEPGTKKDEAEPSADSTQKADSREVSRISRMAAAVRNIAEKIKSAIITAVTKLKDIVGKIKETFLNIRKKIKNIWNKFLRLCHKIKKVYEFITLKENQDCAKAVLKIGTRLLRHMRPRKIKGFVRFGMDDPCRTGQILGVLAVFYGFYGKNISIYPEFESSCLDGEVLIKGYMQIGVILFHALKIYLSKELKTLKYNYQQLKEEL